MFSLPDIILPKVRHFGLSIDKTALRAVEIEASGRIHAMAEVQFPKVVFEDGVLADRDLMVAALKKLFEVGKFTTPYVTVSFPESLAFTRGHSLPILPFEELAEAVSWQTKDMFPFPVEDIYYDWRVVEKREKEYQVMVVAVQKKVIDPLIEALVGAGLKPLRFEPDASAISRLLVLAPGEFALVTELNKRDAYITLVEGEKSLFTTAIAVRNPASPDEYISSVLESQDEIVTFYKQKGLLKDQSTRVVLTGELANDEWASRIGEKEHYPTKLLKTPVGNPAFNKAYAVAAARVVGPEDPQSINVLPPHLQHTYNAQRKNSFYQTLLTRTVLTLGVFCLFSLVSFIAVSMEKQARDEQVKRLTLLTQSTQLESRQLLLLDNQAKHIVSLAPLKATPREPILVLKDLIGGSIIVNQWSYDTTKLALTIDGTAKTRDDLLEFKRKIEDSAVFGKVDLPLGSLETATNVKFSLTFIIR